MKIMCCLAMGIALSSACEAQSLGGIADVTVIDRDTGIALAPHYYRGEYWIAGRPGARYAIEIRNHMAERLLAVTSVDGVNVLSGATAAWDQAGYVFGPEESYQITGWRKSDVEVAAFTFTESPNSYAERTGRPANVGVIGVALYRERAPQVVSPPAISNVPIRPEAPREYNALREQSAPASAPSESAAQSAGRDAGVAAAQAPPAVARSLPMMPAPMAKLGTGHGEREYSYVNHTEFQRMQPQPNEVIRIRYDSLDNLLAMGIIKRGRPMPPTANPFPAAPYPQYVPDPAG